MPTSFYREFASVIAAELEVSAFAAQYRHVVPMEPLGEHEDDGPVEKFKDP